MIMDRRSSLRKHDQNASPELNEEDDIPAAVIGRTSIHGIEPRVPTFDVGTVPEHRDNFDVTKLQLIMRDELMDYNDMTLVPGRITEKVWKDSCLTDLQSVHLHRLNGSDLLELCKDVLAGLTHEMTQKRAAKVMLLAWNMRGLNMVSHIFPVTNPCAAEPAIDVNTLSSEVLGERGTYPYIRPEGIEDEEYIAACAYIAASTLRLFSKSVGSYMTAVDKHIWRSFCRYYTTDFPLFDFKPHAKCIEVLKLIYTTGSMYKNTLAPFLYEFKGLKDAKGMCHMLYEQDLGLTGMHVVNLYLRVCFELHATPAQLGSCIWHRMTKDALISLCKTFRTYVFAPSVNSRGTWRYARLYDTKYFPRLHTKDCRVLLCCIARMCRNLEIGGAHVMQIAELRTMSEILLKCTNTSANWAVAWFRASAPPPPHHCEVSSRIMDAEVMGEAVADWDLAEAEVTARKRQDEAASLKNFHLSDLSKAVKEALKQAALRKNKRRKY